MINKTKLIILIFALSSCSNLPSVNYIEVAKDSAKYITGRNDLKLQMKILLIKNIAL